MQKSFLISLVFALEARARVIVPELTGPYRVGTTVLELVDYSRQDPFAPTPGPRDLAISLFYPTDGHSKHPQNCTLAPQFPPATAAMIDVVINNTGLAETLITRSCIGSPLSRPDLPLLFLGPGLGNPRVFHSDFAGEIASHGWNVVTVDHPYDGFIVEYPDGRAVYATDSRYNISDDAYLLDYLDARVKDLRFVLDSLDNSSVTSQIPGLGSPTSASFKTNTQGHPKPKLRTDKVGVFGHSFGGAAALQLLKEDKRFYAGADLDGGVYGTVVQEGTDSPFLYIRAPNHTHITDPTWAEAWPHLRGFKREYSVNGTKHGSFTDGAIIGDIYGHEALGDFGTDLGPIKGTRIFAIENAFLGAFFGRFLKGEGGELLDGKGLDQWPEVALVGS